MRNISLSVLLFVNVCMAAAAPRPAVGTVASPGKIRLGGTDVQMKGVLSWAVFAGDEINVITAPALMDLHGGVRLLLLSGTTVHLEVSPVSTVTLVTGTLFASCEQECHANIDAGIRAVSVTRKVASVSRHGAAISVLTDVTAPLFTAPSSWLLGMFSFQTGIHRPEDRP